MDAKKVGVLDRDMAAAAASALNLSVPVGPSTDYVAWTQPEDRFTVDVAQGKHRIPADSYHIRKVKDDGWCMYRAWVYAHLGADAFTDDDHLPWYYKSITPMDLWRLACGMVIKMKETGYNFTQGAVPIYGRDGTPVGKGWATQEGFDPATDEFYAERGGNRFLAVQDLAYGLTALRVKGNADAGPLLWPTSDMVRFLDMLLPESITMIYTSPRPLSCKGPGGDGILCDVSPSQELTAVDYTPTGVEPTTMLLHVGGNHFDVVEQTDRHWRPEILVPDIKLRLVSDEELQRYPFTEEYLHAGEEPVRPVYLEQAEEVPPQPPAVAPSLDLLARAAQTLLTAAKALPIVSDAELVAALERLPDTGVPAAPLVDTMQRDIEAFYKYVLDAKGSIDEIYQTMNAAGKAQLAENYRGAMQKVDEMTRIVEELQGGTANIQPLYARTIVVFNAMQEIVKDMMQKAAALYTPPAMPEPPTAVAPVISPTDPVWKKSLLIYAGIPLAAALAAANRVRPASEMHNRILGLISLIRTNIQMIKSASTAADAQAALVRAKKAADDAIALAPLQPAAAAPLQQPAAPAAPLQPPAAPLQPPAAPAAPVAPLQPPAVPLQPPAAPLQPPAAPLQPPAVPASPVAPAAPLQPPAPARNSPLGGLRGLVSRPPPVQPPARSPGQERQLPPAIGSQLQRLTTSLPSPAPAEGVAGIFILDTAGKLLIHQRGSNGSYAGKLGIPMGTVPPGTTHVQQAITELQEEAQVAPTPTAGDLTLFYTTILDGKVGKFYLWRPAVPITVGGPAAGHEAEVVRPFPPEVVIPGLSPAGETGYAWAPRAALKAFLESAAGAAYRSDFLVAALGALASPQPQPVVATPVAATGDIPPWATGYITPAVHAQILRDCSGGGEFIGPECATKAVLRDLFIAEEFKNKDRLGARPNSGLLKYNKLVSEITALRGSGTDPAALERKEFQLAQDYGDIPLRLQMPNGSYKVLPLPNPYRALAYREGTVSFANPAGGEDANDPGGVMRAKNVAVLESLVGPEGEEMLVDSKFATALLEALWFCGQGHVMNDKARCFPALVLAELREMQAAQQQRNVGEIAGDLKWTLVQQWAQQIVDQFKGLRAAEAAPLAPVAAAPVQEEGGDEGGDEAPAPSPAPAPAPAPERVLAALSMKPNIVARSLGEE